MIVTKFSSSSPPSFVRTDVFSNINSNLIMASWVTFQGNEIKLSDGDYIIQDENGNVIFYISSSIYSSDATTQQIIKEHVSKQCLRTIWQTLSQSALTDSVKASILNTILATIVALVAGEVKAAQIIATATSTDTNFTQARKNILLNLLNNAIATL